MYLDTSSEKSEKYTKRELCNRISYHYITQLNLIAGILSVVNPKTNFCFNRIKKIMDSIDNSTGRNIVKVKICQTDDIYEGKIIKQSGFKELLNLYYFHMISIKEEDKESIIREYKVLEELFENLVVNTRNREEEIIKDYEASQKRRR